MAVKSSINHGRRLIPHIVDDKARDHPDQEAFQVPRSADPNDGWKVVTWKEYANAINYVARRMNEVCGQPAKDTFPTLAYIGPNDARYVVLFVAAIKAGFKVLFISPRNSQEGQTNLFDATDCQALLYPKSHHKVAQPLLQERPDMRAVEVGDFASWIHKENIAPVSYTKTYEQAEAEPVVVLHTSGSTGFPKPIVANVGMLSVGDAFHDLPRFQNTEYVWRKLFTESSRMWLPMPLFHAAGLFMFINCVLYWDKPVAFGVDQPLSSDLVAKSLAKVDADVTLLPPAILEDMSQDESCIKAFEGLKFVSFAGGNLGPEAGNRLVDRGVNLVNIIAATEFCPWPYYYQPNPELWQYFIINTEAFGVEWRKTADEEVFEQVVVRKGDHPGLQGVFHTFPDLKEYFTRDLYKRHPSKPDHWIYYGRADNILVFSNGEKLNPIRIEEMVESRPEVKGAVVVGSNRFQPALLIEPTSYPQSEEAKRQLLDTVWKVVVQANKETVAHGQIGRDFLALTDPAKPFPRAGKGTIQRAAAVKLYSEEINQIYDNAGKVSSGEAPKLDISSEDALVGSIQKLFETHLNSPHVEPDTDFFSAGIDSMAVINATRLLRAGLEAAGHYVDGSSLATRAVYGNPTPRRLAQYLMHTFINATDGADNVDEDREQQEAMKQLHEKYTRDLEVAWKAGRPEALEEGQTVVLTGSTGMLGSYLLDLMVTSPRVKKVICLNRAEDGGLKQQAKAMESRGLTTDYQAKAEFYHTDISRNDFGLPPAIYYRLLHETDRWIHNAWPVNFNITVETFEPHLRGVRNVADLAARAAKRVAVLFISSIASADRWDSSGGAPVPERRLEDVRLASGGYGRSKFVGGLVLEDAARAGDFPAAVVRMGQIAGPEAAAGVWNRHEWFPSIVASSLHLRALPTDMGILGSMVDWTPVERVARLVLEVSGVTQTVAPGDVSGYYHGVNPKRATWRDLAPAVQAFYGKERLPELVSFKEWVGRLEKTQSEDAKWMDANPGVKLLDTYRSASEALEAGAQPVVFDMTRTTEKSPAMREAKAVSAELLQHWCEQWGF